MNVTARSMSIIQSKQSYKSRMADGTSADSPTVSLPDLQDKTNKPSNNIQQRYALFNAACCVD